MKKIFTLMLSLGLFTMAFAQQDQQRGYERTGNRDYSDNWKKRNDDRFYDHYSFRKQQFEMKIADINRNYDCKIQEVKNNFWMSYYRRHRMIINLENQRKEEIRCAYVAFNDKRDDYDNHGPRRNW